MLEELADRSDREYVPASSLALVAMALGQSDRAFACLEREYQDRGVFLYWLPWNSWFDDFRADPRFEAICKRLRFPA